MTEREMMMEKCPVCDSEMEGWEIVGSDHISDFALVHGDGCVACDFFTSSQGYIHFHITIHEYSNGDEFDTLVEQAKQLGASFGLMTVEPKLASDDDEIPF